MKKLQILLALVFGLGYAVSAFGHDNDVVHAHSADIAVVQSNLVVHGTVVVENGRLPNSAIVNQQVVWEGSVYTINPETGVLSPRAVDDASLFLPGVRVVKVENGRVTFEYTDELQRTPVMIKKNLKRRTQYGLTR